MIDLQYKLYGFGASPIFLALIYSHYYDTRGKFRLSGSMSVVIETTVLYPTDIRYVPKNLPIVER